MGPYCTDEHRIDAYRTTAEELAALAIGNKKKELVSSNDFYSIATF